VSTLAHLPYAERQALVASRRREMKDRVKDQILWVTDLKKPQNFADFFGNSNPLVLDIGAGKGEFAVAMAQKMPGHNFICIEKRPPRTQAIVRKKLKLGLNNVLVVQCRLEHLFPHCFFRNSIAKAYMNFPDPWPKQAYRNRRNLNEDFVGMLHDLLIPGGDFHFATDVASYAKTAYKILNAHEGFENVLAPDMWTQECENEQKTLFYYHARRDGLESSFLHFRKQ